MTWIKPVSVVYGEYGLNTGFRIRIEMIKKLLKLTAGTSGDWLTFERLLKSKTINKEASGIIVRLPRTRSFGSLLKNCLSLRWGGAPVELRPHYELIIAHAFNSIFAANTFKKLVRAPVILDLHGLWVEEVVGWSGNRGIMPARLLGNIERAMLSHTDGIIYASHALEDFMVSRYPFLAEKPGMVLGCFVDPALFKFAPEARQRLRAEWGWEDCTVMVHAGITAPWVDTVGIRHFIDICGKFLPGVRFLFLSDASSSWREVLHGIADEDKMKIIPVEHKEMPVYLSAADIGLIARIDSPINRVASPTKVAEYLAVGLPVLMSEGIGDYGYLVDQFCLGATIPDFAELTGEKTSQLIKGAWAIDHSRISLWAKENLSFFNQGNNFRKLLEDVVQQ